MRVLLALIMLTGICYAEDITLTYTVPAEYANRVDSYISEAMRIAVMEGEKDKLYAENKVAIEEKVALVKPSLVTVPEVIDVAIMLEVDNAIYK